MGHRLIVLCSICLEVALLGQMEKSLTLSASQLLSKVLAYTLSFQMSCKGFQQSLFITRLIFRKCRRQKACCPTPYLMSSQKASSAGTLILTLCSSTKELQVKEKKKKWQKIQRINRYICFSIWFRRPEKIKCLEIIPEQKCIYSV